MRLAVHIRSPQSKAVRCDDCSGLSRAHSPGLGHRPTLQRAACELQMRMCEGEPLERDAKQSRSCTRPLREKRDSWCSAKCAWTSSVRGSGMNLTMGMKNLPGSTRLDLPGNLPRGTLRHMNAHQKRTGIRPSTSKWLRRAACIDYRGKPLPTEHALT